MREKYKNLVQNSLYRTLEGKSKLSQEVLSLEGMSSSKVRIFLNNLLEMDEAKYLEIGVWKGSTFISALYGNCPDYAVCIENWSQFEGSEDDFLRNCRLITCDYEYFKTNSFEFDKSLVKKKFNIYFYDGNHDFEEQKNALKYFIDLLEDDFIFICDDWNWQVVKDATKAGIDESNIGMHHYWELPANEAGDNENWWNGVFVAICFKNKI